jgi:histidyl-tRNA synthetase
LYRAPRGTSDILPQEQGYWSFIKRKASEICELYGYQRIDTPTFEDARLFERSIGEETDIVEKEMYSFEDKGGDLITLRPEGTAPVCRAYVEHGMHTLPQPVKLYYMAAIFRYERPQAARYRQHHQFGAEAIGDSDPALDAEIIDMAWQLYESLGLKELTLSLNSIGCNSCRPSYLDSLKSYYSQHKESICPDCQRRLLRTRCASWIVRIQPASLYQKRHPKAPTSSARNALSTSISWPDTSSFWTYRSPSATA